MYISIVQIYVKPEFIDAFITASLDNVQNSLREPGVVRFDFLQDRDDPAHFTLYEIYRDAGDLDRHRETAHYARWRDAVADWMAAARTSVKYTNVHPTDADWT